MPEVVESIPEVVDCMPEVVLPMVEEPIVEEPMVEEPIVEEPIVVVSPDPEPELVVESCIVEVCGAVEQTWLQLSSHSG